MAALYRTRLKRASGRWARAGVRMDAVRDTLTNAWVLRRRAPRSRPTSDDGWTMTTMLQDLRDALRGLARSPFFAVSAATLLAIGLGVNIAVFALVDSLLFRPPPWDDPSLVVQVYQDSDDGEPSSSSFPAYRDMAESPVFTSVAAMSPTFFDPLVWTGPDGPRELTAEYATASYLEVVGLSPLRGRWFGPEHDDPGAAPVAVLTARSWRTLFGADPDIVGTTLTLNGQPVTVVGVGPEEIDSSYPPLTIHLWLSISTTPVGGSYRVTNLDRRQDHWYDVRARLAEGVTPEQAQAAMDRLADRLATEFPELNAGRGITVFPSTEIRQHPQGDGDLRMAGWLLLAVVLTVLLLTCANLANLLLVRGLGRSGEMAVRRALGAGRSRVARLFLLESLALSVLGGAGGLLLARWLLTLVPLIPMEVPGGVLAAMAVDGRVLAFVVALILVTALVFGLVPAVRSARSDVSGALRDQQRGGSGSRGTLRLRNGLVAVQVAASLVLVLGTGLLGRSLAALQDTDTGMDQDRVAWVQASLAQAGLQGEEARVALTTLLERVSALPSVETAAVTSRLPAQGGGSTTTVVDGYAPASGTEAVELDFAVVSDDYFQALGIPLVAGRGFGPDDVPGAAPNIVVNEAAARLFWGDPQAALSGRTRGQTSDTWRSVVGVVGDVPVGSLGEAPRPMMYFSARQSGIGSPYLVVRTPTGDPTDLLPALRREVTAVRASLTVRAQGTLRSHLGESLATPRMAALLVGGFSLLSLILAGLGIYAVVSFSVARRTNELGIRMALGAGRARVVSMVLREMVGTVALGVGAGLGLAWLAAGRLEGLLYGVEILSPLTLAGAILFLTAVAGLAAWVPARRAARTDPVEALRAEG